MEPLKFVQEESLGGLENRPSQKHIWIVKAELSAIPNAIRLHQLLISVNGQKVRTVAFGNATLSDLLLEEISRSGAR